MSIRLTIHPTSGPGVRIDMEFKEVDAASIAFECLGPDNIQSCVAVSVGGVVIARDEFGQIVSAARAERLGLRRGRRRLASVQRQALETTY